MQMPFTGERYVPELRGQMYYEHLHRYALAFGMAGDLDVLDIACGEGYGAAYLAIAARSVVGVDIDPLSIRHAASRYTGMNLSFRVGTCAQIPLADASIDLVVSFETIEHIDEHEQFLREIVRVLRPGGQLILSSPNKLVYSDNDGFVNPFHVRELYFDELRDLLRNWFPHCRLYGQRIIAASAIHPLRGLAREAHCITPTTHEGGRGLPALPAPAYFIAVCSLSDEGSTLQELDSVFVDPRDDLLDHIAHPQALPTDHSGPTQLEAGAVEYLAVVDGHDGARSSPVERGLLADLLGTIYDGAEAPPDVHEAVVQAQQLVRSAFDQRRRTTGRLGELDAANAEQRAMLAAADERARAASAEAEALRRAAVDDARRIAQFEGLAAQRDALEAERDALRSDLARSEAERRQLERKRAETEARAEAAGQQCLTLQGRVRDLDAALQHGARQRGADALTFESTARELRTAQGELAGALDKVRRLQEELDRTSALLDGIVRSRSWRATRAARVMMRALRGD